MNGFVDGGLLILFYIFNNGNGGKDIIVIDGEEIG